MIDVCIVCALAEEAQAFLRVVEQYLHLSWSEESSQRYGYMYYLTTIVNVKGESLRLHVSWLPHYGLQEMTLHLSHVVEEYQPRLAIMTGICAGDKRHVHLGDLVVAERTFTYDNGKVVKDELGQSVYRHDTTTYQLHENIKRFVDIFERWKPRVASLARPVSMRQQRDWLLERLLAEPTASIQAIPLAELEAYAPSWRLLVDKLQQKPEPFLSSSLVLCSRAAIERLRYGLVPFPFQDPPEPHCYVHPLASGNAVRSDSPFNAIQIPVRGAIAIDMEGAAFGRVMDGFHGCEWFIVKAVSDYADSEKDDSYHRYAAMASAAYALSFIEAYVTQERLPSHSGTGLLSLKKGAQALWDGEYNLAKKELRKAIESIDKENQAQEASQARYFFALALLGGELPLAQVEPVIKRIEELMQDAIKIFPCASYYCILASILKNYFKHKGLQYRLKEVSALESKAASLSQCQADDENEISFLHCQPRLSF